MMWWALWMVYFLEVCFGRTLGAPLRTARAQQSSRLNDVRHFVYYNSSFDCGAPVVYETFEDLSAFGGACNGNGRCSIAGGTQGNNTVVRTTTCQAAMQEVPQATRANYYTDASCTQLQASFGYSTFCYPGTLQGLDFGRSSRYACDAQGNIFDFVYATNNCEPAGLARCLLIREGPRNVCAPSSAVFGVMSQRVSCGTPEVIPSQCYPSPSTTVATTPPATLIPGDEYDINRDGVSDLLDIVEVLDQWGRYDRPSPDLQREYADIRPLYGEVDIYDLSALWNHQATL